MFLRRLEWYHDEQYMIIIVCCDNRVHNNEMVLLLVILYETPNLMINLLDLTLTDLGLSV